MKAAAILFFIFFTVCAGCSVFENTSRSHLKAKTLSPGNYKLVSLNGKKVILSDSGTGVPSLYPDPAERKISGFAGCNRFFGPLEIIHDSLYIGPVAATKMACPEGDFEDIYLGILSEKRLGWVQRKNRLVLKNARHTLIFRKSE